MPGPPSRPAPPPSTVPGEPEHTVEDRGNVSAPRRIEWDSSPSLSSFPPSKRLPAERSWDHGEVTVQVFAPRSPELAVTIPVLRVVAGRDLLQFTVLEAGADILIGRDELDCKLHLTDASVSRRHARVTMAADKTVVVQDLGATNGPAINGRQIERGFLQVGGHLEVGAVGLRLEELTTKEVGHLSKVLEELARSNQDPLTGLHTRAWLDDELRPMLARNEKSGTPTTAILLDIDHFKTVNDRFGHNVGDDVLRGVARIVLYTIRDGDVAIRYGGEEIMVLLSGSAQGGAVEAANRMLRDIQSHDWKRTAAGLGVTASAGVAERRMGEKTRDWIERADKALYAAKHRGRNQVVSAGS